MRCRPFALAACLALATVAGPVAAQDRAGSFEISPFAGGYIGGRLYGDTPVTTISPSSDPGSGVVPVTTTFAYLEADDDLTYGLRVAYNLNQHFAFEIDWTSARTDMRTPDRAGAAPRNLKVGRLRQNVYEANMLFNFGGPRTVGYVGVGAGAATLDPSNGAFEEVSNTRFTANVSIGAKLFFTPRVGLRLDGRYRAIDQRSGDGRVCDGVDFCSESRDRWSYNAEVTGGLVFAF